MQQVLDYSFEYDVFICHSSKDKPIIERLIKDLKKEKISYWVDAEQIGYGDSITRQIEKGLQKSKYIVPCLSKNLNVSGWTRTEYESILNAECSGNSKRSVIPLKLDNCEDNDIPLLLRDKRRVTYSNQTEFYEFTKFLKMKRLNEISIIPPTSPPPKGLDIGVDSVYTINGQERTVHDFFMENKLLNESTRIDLFLYSYETLASILRYPLEELETPLTLNVMIRNPLKDPEKSYSIKHSIFIMREIVIANPKINFNVRFYDDEPLLRMYIFYKKNEEIESLLGIYRFNPKNLVKFVGAEKNTLIHTRNRSFFEREMLSLFKSRFDYSWEKLTECKAVIFGLDIYSMKKLNDKRSEIINLLKILKSKNIKLGLVTWKPQNRSHNSFIKELFCLFDYKILNTEAVTSIEKYQLLIKELEVTNDNCYIVDSTSFGLKSANEIGITCFAIENFFISSIGDQIKSYAYTVCKDIDELKTNLIWADANMPLKKFSEIFKPYVKAISSTSDYFIQEQKDPFMLKALIFDMDGILIDSMPYHAAAWRQAFSEMGMEIKDEDVYAIEGLNPQNGVPSLIQKAGRKPELYDFEKITTLYRQEFNRIFKLKAFDGMRECLELLKSRFLLSIVSGSDSNIVCNVVDKLFPGIFDIVVTGNDVKNSKPCPDPYLKAVDLLKINKNECIIIENAILGVEAAKKAKIYCIGVPTYLEPSQLKEADLVIGDHKKLIEYLLSL